MIKIKIQHVFKELLLKTIIVFTSIYFESDCKIPAGSNKSIPQNSSHAKGILNQKSRFN